MFDTLFFTPFANHQDIARLGDNVILQSLQDRQAVRVVEGNHVAFALVEDGLALRDGVALGVLVGDVVERAPGTEVGPAEIDAQHIDILGLFHHPVIDGNVWAIGEMLADEDLLLGGVEEALADVEAGGDVRQVFRQRLVDGVHVPDEDTGVPEELAALVEDLGEVVVRLFGESLDLGELAVHRVAALDIAVARLGAAWLDAEGNERLVFLDERQAFLHILEESILAENQMVAGGDNHVGLRVASLDVIRGVGDARSGIAAGGFEEDLRLVQLGQLLADKCRIAFIGNHEDIAERHYLSEAVKSHLQKGPSRAEEIQELLWQVFATEWPETAADSTGHDNAIIVCHDIERF